MDRGHARPWIFLTVCAAALVAACQTSPAPSVAGTALSIDSALVATIWVGCDTVARRANPSGTTAVEICAASDAIGFGVAHPPVSRRPIGRMRNLGSLVERRWGLRPKQVYLIQLERNVGNGRADFLINGPFVSIGPEAYVACRHPKVDLTSRATFGNCGDTLSSGQMPRPLGLRSRGPTADSESPAGPHELLDPLDGPAWLTCRTGCCTTGAY